jgi:hypothetical protein
VPNYDMAADRDRAEDRAEQAARARAAEHQKPRIMAETIAQIAAAQICLGCFKGEARMADGWHYYADNELPLMACRATPIFNSIRMFEDALRSISASTAPSAQRSSNDEVDGCK